MCFTGGNGYQNISVFVPMVSSLTLDNSEKNFTNWIPTEISPEEVKPFKTNLEPTMSNLPNARVNLKLNNSILVWKIFLVYIVTLFLIHTYSVN